MTHGYLSRLPAAVPAGKVLVHNHVSPVARRLGVRGSRAWLSEPDPKELVVCSRGWAPELGVHYCVAAVADTDAALREARKAGA